MIHVVLGTKAQLVKMAPILVRLRDRGVPFRFIHTGQHRATMDEMFEEFGIPQPDVVLHRGRDVVSLAQMALWMAKILARCLFTPRRIFGTTGRGSRSSDVVLVHGDTFSTLLGALMGRLAGLRVGHVESGLRSFDWRNPFPEELTCLATFRLSHTLYCPGSWALGNVADTGKETVDTLANTLVDTLALVPRESLRTDHLPEERFALVSLHRYENIFRRARFEWLVSTLEEMAREIRLLFILHPPTRERLERTGLGARLEANPRIELRPRYTYFDFVALIERAEFVVTDGGSIQEESSYVGVPCLLMRSATERREGLDANAVLSNYDPDVIRAFVRDPAAHRRPRLAPAVSPSDIVVESVLAQAGAVGEGGRS